MLPRETVAEARRILALAWPVTLTNLQWILLNLIDTVLVGQASTLELGYLSAGRVITYVAVVVGIAMLSGILVFTARADGAGEPRRCGDVLRQGLVFAGVLALVSAALLLALADLFLEVATVPAELRGGGALYIRLMALAYVPQFLFIAASYFMEGISRPRVAMRINLATLPLNALLSWMLIGGELGAPALGAAGAALGTGLSVLAAAVVLLAYVHLMPEAAHFGVAGRGQPFLARWRRAWVEGVELRRFGLAPGVAAGFELGGFSVLTALSTGFGAATAGAFQAAVALHNLSLAASLGLGSAAGVRVGNAVGAGDAHRIAARGWIAAGLALATLLVFAVVYFFAAPWLVPPFSSDPAVVATGVAMLQRLAPFLLFDGLQLVFLFCLRSMGDQVVAGMLSITAFFLLMGGWGWFFVIERGAGPLALVDALAAGMVLAALLLGGRFAMMSRRAALAPRPATP